MSDHISPRRSTQSTHRRPAPPLPPDQKLSILRHEQVYELLHTAQRVGVHLYQLWCAPDLFEDSSSPSRPHNAGCQEGYQSQRSETRSDRSISPSDPDSGQIDLAFKLAGRNSEEKGHGKCFAMGYELGKYQVEGKVDMRHGGVEWGVQASYYMAREVGPKGECF